VDSPPTNSPLPAETALAPPTSAIRLRLRFRKGGDLRLLSHHDLLRCFERLLRRGNLPFHRTQGFHPHPRLVFALSLPLGVVGCEEVAELELDEELPDEEILRRLRENCPPGLEILSLRRVSLRSSPQVKSLCYRVHIPRDRAAEVRERIDALMSAEELLVTREGPLNVRPFLRAIRLNEVREENTVALEIDLWLTPAGTAKPVEVLALLGLTDWFEAGAVVERACLELQDEQEAVRPSE
jgi:radical SAM-linked protein